MRGFLKRFRLALVSLLAGGGALFLVTAALPGTSPDPEGIKPVVVAWMHLVLNSDCGPDYRFSTQKPPPDVVERSLREIKRLWGRLWVDCQQKQNLLEPLNNPEFVNNDQFQPLGGTILKLRWDNITVKGNTADVTVTSTARFGGFVKDGPRPGLFISEGTQTEHYEMVYDRGWKIKHWTVVSGAGEAEPIWSVTLPREDLADPAKIKPAFEQARQLLAVPSEIRVQLKPELVGPYL